jgi:hypothetical protein
VPAAIGAGRAQWCSSIEAMLDIAYWRAHVSVDQDPLSSLTFTRAREESKDAGDVSAEAVQIYRELIGLPEEWDGSRGGVEARRARGRAGRAWVPLDLAT